MNSNDRQQSGIRATQPLPKNLWKCSTLNRFRKLSLLIIRRTKESMDTTIAGVRSCWSLRSLICWRERRTPLLRLPNLGEIRSWNKAAEKLFEYSAAEALNSTCHKILQGRGALGTEVCGENCSVRDCAAKHLEIPNFDLEAKARSGRRLWVSVSTLVFENPRNHQRLIVHLAHDITERKKNEQLLRKMINVARQLVAIPDVVANPSPILPLSEQEIEILRSFSVGNNSGVIARKLKITLANPAQPFTPH